MNSPTLQSECLSFALHALMDAQHTHMGASSVKEAFDLPHQDYSKLWTQMCLKLSVLNLDLLLILLLH